MTTTGSRAENAAHVARLHAQGLNGTAIAKRLGLSVSYISALLTDPDGRRNRERKLSYSGECMQCGGRTYGGDGPANAPELCRECYTAPLWTRERIIAAIDQWADDHGGIPPTSLDWRNAVNNYQPGEHPTAQTVRERFGTWNQALEAAGYEPHQRH